MTERDSISIKKFQESVSKTDQCRDHSDIILPLGLVGEVGSIASLFKKQIRDNSSTDKLKNDILEEVGDVMWYIASLASKNHIELESLEPMKSSIVSMQQPNIPLEEVYELIENMASIVREIRSPNNSRLKYNFREIIILIRRIAEIFEDSLESVMAKNYTKTTRRWGVTMESIEKKKASFFDAKYDEQEQLPRRATIEFTENNKGNKKIVYMRMNGINIGDPITDNSNQQDYYRYHDVFHWSYVAVLGWSPVIRSLLRCKRKSCSRIDEVEDGARAKIIEEAISFQIFDYARDRNFLDCVDRVDHDLLKLIKNLTRGLEVDKCTEWEWQKAILEGYKAFYFLRENKGGVLQVNADRREILASKD